MSSRKHLSHSLKELGKKLDYSEIQFAENLSIMLRELQTVKQQLDMVWQRLEAETLGPSHCPLALTTGPVIRSDLVSKLYVEVLNNSDQPQTVRITLFDLEQVPKQHIEHRLVTVHSKHAASESFGIGPYGLDLRKFEIQVESLEEARHGIYFYIAGAQGAGYELIQSNVFRHQELVALE